MRWAFKIGNQMRVSVILAIIVALLVISNLVMQRDIDSMDRSFTSIYNDRLMPATEFFYITETLYQKRLLLEKNVLAPSIEKEDLIKKLDAYDSRIDSLVTEIEKTYFVLDEASLLSEFKERMEAYDQLENKVINLAYANDSRQALAMLENEGGDRFNAMLSDLHQLTEIQSNNGRELLNDSHHIKASVHMLTFLEVGVAIVLSLLVHVILLTTRTVQRKSNQPFHLN